MMARNPDSVKEEQSASNTAVPTPAYNPMSGNPFVNAVGSTASTPVTIPNKQQTTAQEIINANTKANETSDVASNDAEAALTADESKVNAAFAGLNIPGYTTPINTTTNTNIKDAQSAYDLLQSEFDQYGLGALVAPLKDLVQQGASGATMSLALQNTDAYKQRFSANQSRIAKGLAALRPAEYIAMEDQYQNIMRQYGLPDSYYSKDSTGKQAGFDQLLANDVSATELNDRISTAQNRVMNANPEVLQQLKIYYPDITNGDILSYALNPGNALDALKRKVTASEIGGAAAAAGLSDSATQAEQLAAYGITGAQAQQQYGNIAQLAQRGSQLANIYGQQPYGQNQATAEIFNTAGQTEAQNQRKKLTSLEQAQFAGQGGTAQNAFSRDRAISPMMLGVPGAGSF